MDQVYEEEFIKCETDGGVVRRHLLETRKEDDVYKDDFSSEDEEKGDSGGVEESKG